LVHFYNTRDKLGRVESNADPGFGVTGWPAPETSTNVNNAEIGNLRLSFAEEAQLVAFMETLTDNYPATGAEPSVPPGTPSPFADTVLPSIPVNLTVTGQGALRLFGRLGKSFRIEFTDSMTSPIAWQALRIVRLGINGQSVTDSGVSSSAARFYRVVQLP